MRCQFIEKKSQCRNIQTESILGVFRPDVSEISHLKNVKYLTAKLLETCSVTLRFGDYSGSRNPVKGNFQVRYLILNVTRNIIRQVKK